MARTDHFLKIAGVKGDSADPGHPGFIDVLSWQWVTTGSSTGMDKGPKAAEVVLKLPSSGQASMTLFGASQSRRRFPIAGLEIMQEGNVLYTASIVDLFVRGMSASGSYPDVWLMGLEFRDATIVPVSPPVNPEHVTLIHESRSRR